jgi:hypothetical protein
MKAVLEIVKRYAFEIACGGVAVVAIVLALLGLGSMGSITEEMTKAQQLQSQLQTAARGKEVINDAWVVKAQERIDQIKGSFTDVMTYVKEVNYHPPVLEKLKDKPLDKATVEEGEDFKKAYAAEIKSWLPKLVGATGVAGDAPDPVDVQREQDLMREEEPKDTFAGNKKDDTTEGDKGIGKTGSTPKDDSKRAEAAVRAAVRRAREIRCYATAASFQNSDISRLDGPMYGQTPPTGEQLWYAQLELWLQRDIIDAIVKVNDDKAKELTAQADKASSREEKALFQPWVGNMPIKEVISIQTTQYYIRDPATAAGGAAPPPGAPPGAPPGRGGSTTPAGPRRPPGTASTSSDKAAGPFRERANPPEAGELVFTGRFTNELHEVMRFSVKLVVDAREIPTIISGLCEKRFHVPLRVSYEALPPDMSMTGKIYGEGPVVVLTVDFETVFFSELYLSLMPDSVLQLLGKTRPTPETTSG